jgi:cytochrome P450
MLTATTIPMGDPDYWQRPYAILAEFRDQYRTAYADTGELCILRWEDAEWAIKGRDFVNEGMERLESRGFKPGDPLHTWRSHALGIMEGPDHIRIRKLVSGALSKRSVEPLREMIQKHAHELIDQLDPDTPIDGLRSYAYQLPRRVMMEFLGLDAEELMGSEKPMENARIADCFGPKVTSEMRYTANSAIQTVMDHVGALYQARRENPRDDLLTSLLQAEDEQGKLTHPELITLFSTIFGSGGTTGGAIASALLELATHPEQAQILREDPQRWKQGASEETVRMRPGIVEMPQRAAHDFEAFGLDFKEGDTISIPFGAANRDPSRWDNPQNFDITRDPSVWSLSFGIGAHFCIGQAIARCTLEESMAAIVTCFSDIALAEPALWYPFVMDNRMQGLKLKLLK